MSNNVVALKSGGQIAGIVPQTFEDVYRVARCIAESGLAPDGMRTPEQITVAIMTGLEIGLPPMFAVQKIAVINGRPTIWGDAVPALLLSRGFKLREWHEAEGDERAAYCEVTRPDGDKITRRFTVRDAVKAGLWQTQAKVRRKAKDGSWYEKDNDSPWYRFQDRMLQMRARGYACRDGAADVLSGLYLREEIDEPMRDITPKPAAAVLEIPDDIPDNPGLAERENAQPDLAKSDQSKPDTEADEPLADPDSVLAKISDDLALCDSVEEVAEVEAQYADWMPRLSKSYQKKAAQLFKSAKE